MILKWQTKEREKYWRNYKVYPIEFSSLINIMNNKS